MSPKTVCDRCDDTGCPKCDPEWERHQRRLTPEEEALLDRAIRRSASKIIPGTPPAAPQEGESPFDDFVAPMKIDGTLTVASAERVAHLEQELTTLRTENAELRKKVEYLELDLATVNTDKAAYLEGQDSAYYAMCERWNQALTEPPTGGACQEPLQKLIDATHALRKRAEDAERGFGELKAAFRANMIRAFPGVSHARIDAEIARAIADASKET